MGRREGERELLLVGREGFRNFQFLEYPVFCWQACLTSSAGFPGSAVANTTAGEDFKLPWLETTYFLGALAVRGLRCKFPTFPVVPVDGWLRD